MKQKIQRDAEYHKRLIEGVIAVALLCGIVWFLVNNQEASAPSSTEPSAYNPTSQTNPNNSIKPPSTATNTPAGTDVVVVSTQTAGSKSVTIDNASLSKAGFIVIMKVGDTGLGPNSKPTVVIGTSNYLTAGNKQDLIIPINQKLISGDKYIADIYVDNGDKKFNGKTDSTVSLNNYFDFTAK